MGKKISKFVNKYFSSPLKKKKKKSKRNTSVSSFLLSSFLKTLGGYEQYPLPNGHEDHRSTPPSDRKPGGALSIHLSVAGLEMRMVVVRRSKRSAGWSAALPRWTVRSRFLSHIFHFSSYVVVLVWVFLVTLHIVPVDERLYPFLQVSRLKRAEIRQRSTLSISVYF